MNFTTGTNSEQFRRRKQYHSHFDMPKEFYAEFGANKREFKSEFDPTVGSEPKT